MTNKIFSLCSAHFFFFLSGHSFPYRDLPLLITIFLDKQTRNRTKHVLQYTAVISFPPCLFSFNPNMHVPIHDYSRAMAESKYTCTWIITGLELYCRTRWWALQIRQLDKKEDNKKERTRGKKPPNPSLQDLTRCQIRRMFYPKI